MFLKEITVCGFGIFARERTFNFSKSFNLILGWNESGKSTLKQALEASLYGLDKEEVKTWQSWHNPKICRCILLYENEIGELFRIKRDYKAMTSSLEKFEHNAEPVVIETAQTAILNKIVEDLGIRNKNLFKNTIYVSHEALRPSLSNNDVNSIKDAVFKTAKESESVEHINNAISHLKIKYKQLWSGANGIRSKRDELMDKLHMEEQKLDASLSLRMQIKEKLSKLKEIDSNLKNLQAKAKELESLYQMNIQHDKLLKNIDKAENMLASIDGNLELLTALNQARLLHSDKRKKIYYTENIINSYRKQTYLEEGLKNLKDKIQFIEERIKKLGELEIEIQFLKNCKETKNKMLQEVTEEGISNLKGKEVALKELKELFEKKMSEIQSLPDNQSQKGFPTICGRAFPGSIRKNKIALITLIVGMILFLLSIYLQSISITTNEINIIGFLLSALLIIFGVWKKFIRGLKISKEIALKRNIWKQDSKLIQERMKQIEEEISLTLEQYSSKSIEKLQEEYVELSCINRELEKFQTLLDERKGKASRSELEIEREKLIREIEYLESLIKNECDSKLEQGVFLKALDDCQKLNQELAWLEEKIVDIEKKIGDFEGGINDENKLHMMRKEIEKDLNTWQAELEKYRDFHLDPSEVIKIQRDRESMQKEIQRLKEEHLSLKGEIKGAEELCQDMVDIEAEKEYLEKELKKLTWDCEVLTLAMEYLGKVAMKYCEHLWNKVSEELSKILSSITENKYKWAFTDKSLKRLSIINDYGMEVSPIRLSNGTADQFYFALRMSLVHAIAQSKKPPLIFDDSFNYSDRSRVERIGYILKELSKTHQVIYFSVNDVFANIADNIIYLSDMPGSIRPHDEP